MARVFINKISVRDVRNLPAVEIPLREDGIRHLIITGKNGSGKSTLLQQVRVFFDRIHDGSYQHYEDQKRNLQNLEDSLNGPKQLFPYQVDGVKLSIKGLQKWFRAFGGTEVQFNLPPREVHQEASGGTFVLAYFDSRRNTKFAQPTGITKIDFQTHYAPGASIGQSFVQHLVNLKADRSFANDDGDAETAARIDAWFVSFEKMLHQLLEGEFSLHFDRQAYNFHIEEKGKLPYTLNQLSDGYAAILNIVTELVMRSAAHKIPPAELQGAVLIDNIEAHLHPGLQRKILPLLTAFFPKIQFIVTTHSPFVLDSLDNAALYDLDKNALTPDLSGFRK